MKKILNIFLVGILLTGLSSCLKDKTMIGPDSPGAIKNVIEFANIGPITSGVGSIYPVYLVTYDASPTGELELTLNYAGAENAPEDIKVNVAVDFTILTKYNAKLVKDARDAAIALDQDPNAAELAIAGNLMFPLPTNAFNVPATMEVTIPKGKRTASLKIGVVPPNFLFDHKYALPVKIASASTGVVSGNFGNIIVQIVGKNAYDGIYSYSGTMLRIANGVPDLVLGGTFTNIKDSPLASLTANSVSIVPLWADGSTAGGIPNTKLTVDPLTNLVTVTSDLATLRNTAGAVNKYDPATKTFTLAFEWNMATATPRSTTVTMKYLRPR